jgi:predicted deacetylase
MNTISRAHRHPDEAQRRIAVAIHAVEPASFERCALIRDWLNDHGIDRVTLLAVPARDLHPLGERSPEMVQWLRERERRGDAIAQHGFRHVRSRRGSRSREVLTDVRAARLHGRGAAEFVGLDADETRRAVESGRRVLKLAGIEPRGFVAPSYAYTPALREIVAARFSWWAEMLHVRRAPGGGEGLAMPHAGARAGARQAGDSAQAAGVGAHSRTDRLFPPIAIGATGSMRRAMGPTLVRAGAALAGNVLRVDLHASDVDHPRHMMALEWVLGHAHGRTAVTYDELAGVAGASLIAPSSATQPLAA